MGFLDAVRSISTIPYNRMTVLLGKPGSGKTTVAGTFPKPMLYVSIGSDGGGVVLSGMDDIDVVDLRSNEKTSVYMQMMSLIEELRNSKHKYKSVVVDAYSSIEEDQVTFAERAKGKQLSLDERGAIMNMMVRMRDAIVSLAEREREEYVLICHIKNKEDVDNITGEKSMQIIPKMTYNNGNILLERASNVMYCTRKPVKTEDGKTEVRFLTYIGPHPYIDTKLRTRGVPLPRGLYIEDCTYAKVEELKSGTTVKQSIVVDVPESKNPFEEEKTEGEW